MADLASLGDLAKALEGARDKDIARWLAEFNVGLYPDADEGTPERRFYDWLRRCADSSEAIRANVAKQEEMLRGTIEAREWVDRQRDRAAQKRAERAGRRRR